MKFRNLAAAVAVASLATAPAIAQDRTSAPADAESAFGGEAGGTGIILAVLAAAAIIAGIVIAADGDDDDALSP